MKFHPGMLLVALITLIFVGCSESEDPTHPNTFTPLSSLELSAPLNQLALGTSTPISALGNFSGLFIRDVSDQVLWTTTNPQVAVISNEAPTIGRLSALSPGSVSVRAELEGVSQTIDIEVTADVISTLRISPDTVELPQGLRRQLQATGIFAGGPQNLTFDAEWSSQNGGIATVSNDPASKGQLRGITPGETRVVAGFGDISAEIPVRISEAALERLAINPRDPTLANLVVFPLRATGSFSNGENLDLTSEVNWSSADTQTAQVGNSGVDKGRVTTLRPGRVRISAGMSGLSAVTDLNVVGTAPTSLVLNPADPTLANGTSLKMTARANLTGGGVQDVTELVTWSSVNTNVVSVSNLTDQRGLLNAQNQGDTTVTAVLGSLEISVPVAVHVAPLSQLVINPAIPATLPVDTSLKLSAIGTFNARGNQDLTRDVTWSSSNFEIATVENSGLDIGRVRARAPGNVSIHADFGNTRATVDLVVDNILLDSIILSPTGRLLRPGQNLSFTATGRFEDGINRDITQDVQWSSSNSGVAAISNDAGHRGRATALSPGTTEISALFQDLTDLEGEIILTVE